MEELTKISHPERLFLLLKSDLPPSLRRSHLIHQRISLDLAAPTETFIDKTPSSKNTATSAYATKETYVHPSIRASVEIIGTDMRHKHEEIFVRVTNLSEVKELTEGEERGEKIKNVLVIE
ncbi:Eukaryotic translation initiation factor 3 subunit G [Forsythia ovata]|uniref:Eukaryotic translation initiation factor 3 subunit G n=1 Tax=Forsythia ovata TaxID=205694 RepID=A0ABD1RMF6_9LAMI